MREGREETCGNDRKGACGHNGEGGCGIMSICRNKAGCLMVLKHVIKHPSFPYEKAPSVIPDTPPVIPDVSNRESRVFLAGRFLH